WKRAEVLLDHLRRTYPALAGDIPRERLSFWMGHRPSTPDGLPVIGPASACHDVVHAFGHGHVGLAAGPATARLVADVIAGRKSPISIQPYSATRFRWW